jgi:hypothetical protein
VEWKNGVEEWSGRMAWKNGVEEWNEVDNRRPSRSSFAITRPYSGSACSSILRSPRDEITSKSVSIIHNYFCSITPIHG